MATLLKTDGSKEDIPYPSGLKKKQKLVGGCIEFINLPDNSSFLMNEEGAIKLLPVNELAKQEVKNQMMLWFDDIYGDVIHLTEQETLEFYREEE